MRSRINIIIRSSKCGMPGNSAGASICINFMHSILICNGV